MDDFLVKLPDFIFFGKEGMNNLNRIFKKNIKKVLIITGKKGAKISGAIDELIIVLKKNNVKYLIYDEIRQNPDTDIVDMGGEIANKFCPDYIIAIGGGSVMDAAKGIAIINHSGGKIWDYVYDGIKKPRKIIGATPIIAIPTIAASGSEADAGAVFTNKITKEKIPIGSIHIIPRYAVDNPKYTLSVPPQQTAYGVMDIFSHITESFISTRSDNSEYADEITIAMLKVLIKALPEVLQEPDDYRWRAEIMFISTLAITGIPSAGRKGSMIMHYLEHPLSGHFDIIHGKGLAAIIIPYLKIMKKMNGKRVEKFFKYLFNLNIDSGIEKLVKWKNENMLDVNLTEDGLKAGAVEKLAEDCIRNYSKGNGYLGGFKEFDKNMVMEIYRKLVVSGES
jgi:alcohol dehydrogenase YqhD (iron-dependent ADH family)